MKKFLIYSIFFLFGSLMVPAQLWQSVGGGFNRYGYSLYADTVEGLLYAAGDFDSAGGAMACQIATWDGVKWEKVVAAGDTACPYDYGNAVSVLKMDSQLFLGGSFSNIQGMSGLQFLLKWDGVQWDTSGNPNSPAILENVNGQLLAMGFLNEIGGHKVGRIGKWNGIDAWEPFCDSLPFEQGGGYIITGEYFDNQYVFAGNFSLPGDFNEVAAWDGQQWKALGTGFLGDPWINKLKVFQSRLFAGGHFQAAEGNVSDYIAAWDGNAWFNPFPNVSFVNQVRDMQVIDGVLYILGGHYVWNGVTWQGLYQIASYDGIDFCSFGGTDILPKDIAGLNGRLYVTTSYYNHPDQFKGIAEWIGGNAVDICVSQLLAIDSRPENGNAISLFPNPVSESFAIHGLPSSTGCILRISSIVGQTIMASRNYLSGEVDVSGLPAGVYSVEVRMRDRVEVVKLVKE